MYILNWFKKHRQRCVCGGLALIMSVLGIVIFGIALYKYTIWWRTTRLLKEANDALFTTLLLTAASAPFLSTLGLLAGGLYYHRKRRKFGKYDVRMRRQGRGYWIDPSDADEKKKEKEAAELNKGLKGQRGRRARYLQMVPW
jgi:uncharacterized iron-regulated membrane protein